MEFQNLINLTSFENQFQCRMKISKAILAPLIITMIVTGCTNIVDDMSFSSDIKNLQKVENLKVLKDGNAMLAVSPAFQGRVFTSSANGMEGSSIGYFNLGLLEDPHFMNRISELGGESRMWFGPEMGDFAVFYEPGSIQTDDYRKISPDLDKVHFQVKEEGERYILSGNQMEIRNAYGYKFHLYAERKISLKTQKEIEEDLGIELNENIAAVAFCAESRIRNTGTEQWKKESGLLSIWELGCMKTTPSTIVMIPTRGSMDSVTNYFTPLEGRIKINDSTVYFKVDASYMSKIGIPHEYCKDVLGSYSPEKNLLTIMKYRLTSDSIYVNSVKGSKRPYEGDVINIFNGDIQPERDWYLPFFELESSSASKELKPGEEQYHWQSLYHFEGDKKELNSISRVVLGIDLNSFF
jgi:hypothetical protein